MLLVLLHSAWSDLDCIPDKKGHHKDYPSPEDSLPACKQYSCGSCCTVESSKAMALNPLQSVGRWNFTQCNQTLSTACSRSFTDLLCFYKCSPNLYVYNDGKLRKRIPLCSWYCDRWFETCMGDLTCVNNQNWVLGGFNMTGDIDTCKYGARCRNYTEAYSSGRRMCNELFSDFFSYSEDKDNCLDPFDEGHTAEVVDKQFGSDTLVCEAEVTYSDAGKIVGIVFGVLGGIFIILLIVAFYMRSKKSEGGKNKAKETGTQQEMSTMNAPATAPSANVPKDESDSD